MRDENFGWIKLAGVLLGMLGSFMTTLNDANNDESDSSEAIWGDVLGLVSAVGYGAYAVQTRVMCPHDESLYSMQLVLGYIGLIDMCALAPFALWEAWGNAQLTTVVLGFVVVKGLFDNVLSDYLWLRAVILTNATVATVGLGLTIPLAFGSDLLLDKADVVSMGSILGALTVLLGFVLVNVGNQEEGEVASSGTAPVAARSDDRRRYSDGGPEVEVVSHLQDSTDRSLQIETIA